MSEKNYALSDSTEGERRKEWRGYAAGEAGWDGGRRKKQTESEEGRGWEGGGQGSGRRGSLSRQSVACLERLVVRPSMQKRAVGRHFGVNLCFCNAVLSVWSPCVNSVIEVVQLQANNKDHPLPWHPIVIENFRPGALELYQEKGY